MRTALAFAMTIVTALADPAVAGAQAPPVGAPETGPGAAPQAERTTLLSLTVGLSFGTPDAGGHGSLSVSSPGGDVILRIAESSDIMIFTGGETVRDIALLYGRRTPLRRGWARAAAGLGHVRHISEVPSECTGAYQLFCGYDRTVSSGVGLALQIDAVWAPSRAFGLGLGITANVNEHHALGVVTVSVHLGQMR